MGLFFLYLSHMNSIQHIQQRIKQQQDYIDKLDKEKKASDERYKELRENAEIIQRHWEKELLRKACDKHVDGYTGDKPFVDKVADTCVQKIREDTVLLRFGSDNEIKNDERFTYIEKDRRVIGP